MLHQAFLTLIFLIVCFKSTYVFAVLSEKEYYDLLEATTDAAKECIEKFDLSSSEAEKMYTDPNYKYDPLYLNCFFTECEIMEKGVFNLENFMALTKHYLHNEDELAKSYKIRQKCSQVNEAKVSDGEVGYGERAMLLYNCLKENGDHFVIGEE